VGLACFKPHSSQGDKITVIIGEERARLRGSQFKQRFIVYAALPGLVEVDHIVALFDQRRRQTFPDMFVEQQPGGRPVHGF
jgi:hypothetical protein